MKSVPERVNIYIHEGGGYPFCDGCITNALGLGHPQHVQQITAALGTTGDFTREVGTCSLCKKEAKVIRSGSDD